MLDKSEFRVHVDVSGPRQGDRICDENGRVVGVVGKAMNRAIHGPVEFHWSEYVLAHHDGKEMTMAEYNASFDKDPV